MTGWVADRGLGTKKKRGGQGAENTQHWVTVYVGVEITKNYEKCIIRRNDNKPGANIFKE